MKKNSLFAQVITIGSSIALSTACLLNSTSIADSAESHTIDFLSSGGSFCEMWLASDKSKKHKIIAAPEGSRGIGMKIDGKEIDFKLTETDPSSPLDKIGKRRVTKYESGQFQLKLDLVLVKNVSCDWEREGLMTISNAGWKRKMKVKLGCDSCG
jgi:hypothetical protein